MDVDTESIADTLDIDTDGIDFDADESTQAPQGNDGSEETPADADKGTEGDKADESKADWETRYNELRSMNDRRFSEEREARAKLEGQLEALTRQQSSASEAEMLARSKQEQEAFNKKWADILEEEPGRVVEYQQAMAQEIISATEARAQALLEDRLKALDIENKLRQVQPGYKENQAKIEEFQAKYNVPFETAAKMVEDFADKSVRQPNAPKVPGTVGDGKAPSNATATVQPYALSEAERHMMKMAGLSDKDINNVAKDIAKDLAGGE